MDAFYSLSALRNTLLSARTTPRLSPLPAPDCSELHIPTRFERIENDIQSCIHSLTHKRKHSGQTISEGSALTGLVDKAQVRTLQEYEEMEHVPKELKSYMQFRAAAKLRIQEKNLLACEEYENQSSSFLNDALLVSIALYHPSTGRKAQELLLDSSQCLSDISTNIYCLSDHMNIEERTPVPPYFVIENQRYEDMRVVLSSLTVRIGVTYKYVHRTSCCHNLLFTDLRLATDQDAPMLSDYPRLTFTAKTKRKKCEICQSFHACFLTLNDPIASKKLLLMCEFCFKNLHYREDGELVYSDFKVLPYLHD